MTAKADVLEQERQLRDLEEKMRHAKGDELEQLLNAYTRTNQTFEQNNGYAVRSEVTGILKGLGFTENDFSQSDSPLRHIERTLDSLEKRLIV